MKPLQILGLEYACTSTFLFITPSSINLAAHFKPLANESMAPEK